VVHSIGRASFGPAAGAAAALLMALHPGLIYMCWRLMAETVCIFLLALAVWWGGRAAAAGSARWAAAAGAAMGAAMLCKLNLVLAVPLLSAWPAWAMAGRGGRRLAVAAAGAAGCAALLLLLPLANRLSSAGAAEPLPSNGGETLWWSNNPLAEGYFVDPDGTAAGRAFIDRHGQAAALAARDPFVRSRADRQLAVAWVRENPGAFVRLAGRKLWNAFGPAPRSEVLARHPMAAWLHAALTAALVPLCLAGMWWTRGALRAAMPLYLLLGGAVAMTVVCYGSPRFTLQVMPFLLLFAGAAAARLLPSLALPGEAA
jgi:4-amino-4-deoxy-L-arabinose transferase-like glycosyltransferase